MTDYYSREMDMEYMSVSQLKKFIGYPARPACEAKAIAELNGEWESKRSDALLIGSYLDVSLTGTEEERMAFLEEHPEMVSSKGATKGQLKAQFKQADGMVARIREDRARGGVFMKYLEGEMQKIYFGEIHGYKFKGKLDVVGDGWICDLKSTESISKMQYSKGWYNFIDFWGYDLQGAIYQELVYQNTGKRLPFYIAAVSKETEPDLGIFRIPQESLDLALDFITPEKLERIDLLKKGEIEPIRCEHCDYCRHTKIITKPMNYKDIGGND